MTRREENAPRITPEQAAAMLEALGETVYDVIVRDTRMPGVPYEACDIKVRAVSVRTVPGTMGHPAAMVEWISGKDGPEAGWLTVDQAPRRR